MALLEIHGVSRRYGGVAAVADASLSVQESEIVGLIGPNGAGKTTLFNCVSGIDRVDAGRIVFDGRDITTMSAHRRARLGMARTFQNLLLFPRMTVLENLKTAADTRSARGVIADAVRIGKARFEERRAGQLAGAMLHLLELDAVAGLAAGDLPIGTQRRVEIARALCLRPRLLLLDEPAAGLDSAETAELCHTLQNIVERFHTAMLLVDHDMSLVMRVCNVVHVLDRGRTIAAGPPESVQADAGVILAYLGEAA